VTIAKAPSDSARAGSESEQTAARLDSLSTKIAPATKFSRFGAGTLFPRTRGRCGQNTESLCFATLQHRQ